jgi:hypothetical protein
MASNNLPLTVGTFLADKVASNLKRADVVVPGTDCKVGMVSRQEYRCKGGVGITLKSFAVLGDGISLTFVGSVSLNGGEVTRKTEHAAMCTVIAELSTYVNKHGVPKYRYTAELRKAEGHKARYWWVMRHDGHFVCCFTAEADAKRTAGIMNESQCQLFSV